MDTSLTPGSSTTGEGASLSELWAANATRLSVAVSRRLPPVLAPVLDTEDILQAAFPDVARRWEAFRARRREDPTASAYVWLYGIVMARLVDEYRRHTRQGRDRRRNLPWPEASSVQLGLSLVDDGRSPSSALAAADARDRMRQTLDRLPDADRQVLWMRHFDELSLREIAEFLGVSENAAAQRYVRALRKLRAVWATPESAGGGAA